MFKIFEICIHKYRVLFHFMYTSIAIGPENISPNSLRLNCLVAMNLTVHTKSFATRIVVLVGGRGSVVGYELNNYLTLKQTGWVNCTSLPQIQLLFTSIKEFRSTIFFASKYVPDCSKLK